MKGGWPRVLMLLPDLALGLLCIALLLRLMLPATAPEAPRAAAAAASTPAPAEARAARLSTLIAAVPFGPTGTKTPDRTAETLVLAGVMLAEESTDSRAILTLPSGEQRAFGIGGLLPDGRRVTRVAAAAVEIEGPDGRRELALSPREQVPGAPSQVATAFAVAGTPAAPRSGMLLDRRENTASQRFLADLRRDASRDPRVLAALADIEPVSVGDTRGFRVHGRNSAALLARLGLESGDLVTQVNGIRLDDPLSGLAAADELVASEELTVEIVRNGVPVTVKLRAGVPAP